MDVAVPKAAETLFIAPLIKLPIKRHKPNVVTDINAVKIGQ